MTVKFQYIIVFAILAGIIIWLVYNLVTKKYNNISSCAGCALAENCKKKELKEQGGRMPVSCGDCPEGDTCEKKGTFLECGGSGHQDS